jgi:hypothetical protein
MSRPSQERTDLATDIKVDHELLEGSKETADVPAVLVSRYDHLSRGEVMRKFWRLFTIGVLVATAGM